MLKHSILFCALILIVWTMVVAPYYVKELCRLPGAPPATKLGGQFNFFIEHTGKEQGSSENKI